jgi:Outer membrane lipoprotein-sorting protein
MNFKPIALALLSLATVSAEEPDADALLAGARISAALINLNDGLKGAMRKGGRKVDLMLFLKGKDTQFQFSENKGEWEVFHMRIGEDKVGLWETVNGKPVEFPSKKLTEPIRETDLTYEDLSLRFLYWPGAVMEGREDVAGQSCYKIRVNKPKGAAGRYDVVYVWVHEKFGAFMRIRGHDRNGGQLKEFQVEDVMQIAKDTWTLRKMQVSTHDPATGRRISITDVTFDTPNQKAGPRGLR